MRTLLLNDENVPRLLTKGLASFHLPLSCPPLVRACGVSGGEQAGIGTPLYLAPEAARLGRAHIDPFSTDVYSAALCLWYLWHGRHPFARLARDPFGLIMQVGRSTGRQVPLNMPSSFPLQRS